MPDRNPIAAGRFYPADARLLFEQVEACYRHPLGPGGFPPPCEDLPDDDRHRLPRALIVPHGALGHSGPIAAHAYGLLARTVDGTWPGHIVLLGPDHFGQGAAISSTTQDYTTPLGAVPTDEELLRRLSGLAASKGFFGLVDAPGGHAREHALENQLPFIQHLAWRLYGDPDLLLPPFQGFSQLPKLLPLTMAAQDIAAAETLAELLDAVLPSERVVLIASSDMCHCGPLYGNLPRTPYANNDIAAWCITQRQQALDAIRHMDEAYLVNAFYTQGLSMCGVGAVATAISFARLRGAASMQVLAASDSVEVARAWQGQMPADSLGNAIYPWNLLSEVDQQNPVGFAAIAIY